MVVMVSFSLGWRLRDGVREICVTVLEKYGNLDFYYLLFTLGNPVSELSGVAGGATGAHCKDY